MCNFKEYGPMRFIVNKKDPDEDAIYIVDVDLILEFLPPIGYEEKLEKKKSVKRYVEYESSDLEDVRIIKMKKRGVCFDY